MKEYLYASELIAYSWIYLTTLFLLGHIILAFFNTTHRKSVTAIFFKFIVGFCFSVLIMSLYYTRGVTMFSIWLIPVGYYLKNYLDIKNLKNNFQIRFSDLKSILFVLLANNLVMLFQFIRLSFFDPEIRLISDRDITFYLNYQNALKLTGIESIFSPYKLLIPDFNLGVYLYHYIENWSLAFMEKLYSFSNVNLIDCYWYILMPLIVVLQGLGMIVLYQEITLTELSSNFEKIISGILGLVFINFIYFLVPSKINYGGGFPSFYFIKFSILTILTIVATIRFVQKSNFLEFLLLMMLPIACNVLFLPICILTSILMTLIIIWREGEFNRNLIKYLKYLLCAIFPAIFFFVYLLLFGSKEIFLIPKNDISYTTYSFKYFESVGKIFLSEFTLSFLAHFSMPIMLFYSANFSNTNSAPLEGFKNLLIISFCILFSGILTNSLMFNYSNSWQFNSITHTLVNPLLMLATFILTLQKLRSKFTISKLIHISLASLYLILNVITLIIGTYQYFPNKKSFTQNSFSKKFIYQVKSNRILQSRFGIWLDNYSNIYKITYSLYQYGLVQEIDSDLMCISFNVASDNTITSYYLDILNQKKKNISNEESIDKMIRENNINWMVTYLKDNQIPVCFKKWFPFSIEDPISKIKIYYR